MIQFMQMGGASPPGWSYNPSSWAQRSVLMLDGWPARRLVTGPGTGDAVAMVVTGLVVTAVAVPRGPIRETYGGWPRLTA